MLGRIIENINLKDNVTPNTQTTFNFEKDTPILSSSCYVHHFASVIGSVELGKEVFVGPFASVRGDEGLKIHIGDYSNIQDGVVVHGLKNFEFKSPITAQSVYKGNQPFSVFIGDCCSLAPQSQVHGPVLIGNNVYIGMQCLVFDSRVEDGVVMEPGSKAIGVSIPSNRYISAGKIITKQEEADKLPRITEKYGYYKFNEKVVDSNRELALGYKGEQK